MGKRIALLQFDGKLPNLALMRLSAKYRAEGFTVDLYRPDEVARNSLGRYRADVVFGSLVFEGSRALAEEVRRRNPGIVLGGTGWNATVSLPDVGVETVGPLDYTLYPDFGASIGFTSRGCRRRCEFCTVPRAEGSIRGVASVADVYRGEGSPRRLLLLDNDFLGQPEWRERLAEVREGGFRVCLCQGINLRTLTEEQAAELSTVDYRALNFSSRRIYGAWDALKDERLVLRGIRRLVEAGVEARRLMIYILIGFEAGRLTRIGSTASGRSTRSG